MMRALGFVALIATAVLALVMLTGSLTGTMQAVSAGAYGGQDQMSPMAVGYAALGHNHGPRTGLAGALFLVGYAQVDKCVAAFATPYDGAGWPRLPLQRHYHVLLIAAEEGTGSG